MTKYRSSYDATEKTLLGATVGISCLIICFDLLLLAASALGVYWLYGQVV